MSSDRKSDGSCQNLSPGQLMEISGSYWKSCALHAGVKLDVFTAIGDAHLKSEEIAEKLDADNRGLTVLLNALAAMNLLIKADDGYANTSTSTAFLSKDASTYIGHIILHHHHLVESWAQLDQAVQTGKPVRSRASFKNKVVLESFIMGMFNMAMSLAPKIVEIIDLSGRRHLLDLGGGPGTYAIHFCLQHPELNAKVYDLSVTRPFAEKTIEKFGLTDRIDFVDCNYLRDSIDETFDAAWLSHIFHAEGPENCQKIIQKTVSALEPGGMIIVHDFILNNTMDGPLFPALFSLNMLLGTRQGRSYSEKQITDMLAGAGVKKIERVPFKAPNDSGIITGVV